MRLIKQDMRYVPQLTTVWEAEELAARPALWIPFCLTGTTKPIGEIHSETLEVRLYPGVEIRNRQVVALAGPDCHP